MSALIGCISGAVLLDETTKMIEASGLTDAQVSVKTCGVDIMDQCNDALYGSVRRHLPEGRKLSDYVASADITAVKTTLPSSGRRRDQTAE